MDQIIQGAEAHDLYWNLHIATVASHRKQWLFFYVMKNPHHIVIVFQGCDQFFDLGSGLFIYFFVGGRDSFQRGLFWGDIELF